MNQDEIINYNLLRVTLRKLVETRVNIYTDYQSEVYYDDIWVNILNFHWHVPSHYFLIYNQLKTDNNTELPYLKRLELENRSISELQKLSLTESILKELE